MYKKLAATLVATGAVLAATGTAAIAAPTGEFSIFAQCPTSNSAVGACLYARTEGGEFVVGKKTVPITKTITLQGGLSGSGAETSLVAALNGETLSKTPQNVPGGLAGLVNCTEIGNFFERLLCEATFENGVTGVTATTELAAAPGEVKVNPDALLFQSGTALKLPVKVHLENPFLGSGCYVGSNSKPVELELTTGTTAPPAPNQPISGSRGEIAHAGGGEILEFNNNVLVNNSFSAPAASGCGGLLSFIIDPIIDSEMGVPSAAGHNTAILKGTLAVTSAEAVEEEH